MAYCPGCGEKGEGNYCSNCGYKLNGDDLQIAATTERVRKKVVLSSGIIFIILFLLLFLGVSVLQPVIFAKSPNHISTSTIVSTLHNEFSLNVLEDQAVASYQVSDPQLYELFGFRFKLPFLEKTVTVDYNYTIIFGIDLTRLSKEDVKVSGKAISLIIDKPTDTVLVISNEHARTDGGLFSNKNNPLDDAIELDPSHEPLTNTLMRITMENLKSTGQYQVLQERAMANVEREISNILRTTLGSDITMNVTFK